MGKSSDATYEQRPWLASYPKAVPRTVGEIRSGNAYGMLVDASTRHPNRPAISWFGRHLSYRELERECGRFAAVLSSLGVAKGDRVGLILPNCPQYVIAYYATLRLGAVVVGNNPLYTERELAHQLTDAGVSVAVVLDSLYAAAGGALSDAGVDKVIATRVGDYLGFPKKQLAQLKLRREAKKANRPWPPVPADAPVVWWSGLMTGATDIPGVAEIDAEMEPAAFVYTGGTTGTPKAAVLSHRNIVANAMQSSAWFVGTEDGKEAILCVLPFFHCYGMTVGMNLGILQAAKLILVPKWDLRGVLREIQKERASLFPGVPKIYITITESEEVKDIDLSSIKFCLSGAGALPGPVARRFEELTGGRLAEGYGLTECSPVAVGNPLDGTARIGTIGIPLPDTDCKLVDLDDPTRTVGIGERGELCIRGPQVMLGYWNRPDETADVLLNAWLRTGDIAVMDADGYFTIVDRAKDIIKVSGFAVYPAEIEELLCRHPKISRACVVGIPDRSGEERVKAFVVLKPGEVATAEEIIGWCKDSETGMAWFRVPKVIEFRDALPESMVGKILRRVLMEEERERARS